MESSSSSGSYKRARITSNGTQVPTCLVDGCTSDLSKCRDYHRRHKVCEIHSKTARVFIKGIEQRFCQQCSRFHSLMEFDDGKRSCRKRLDGHNRRRRKPQLDIPSRNPALLSPGTRYLQFVSSNTVSTTGSSAWGGAIRSESEPSLYNNHSLNFSARKNPFPESLSFSCKGQKQFPFLQGTSSTGSVDSINQSDLDASPTISNNVNSSQKICSDGLVRVINSNCALSLLSSPPPADMPLEIGFNQLMQPSLNLQAQPLVSNLGRKCEPVPSVLMPDGDNNSDTHGQRTFQIGTEGSSVTESPNVLSFSWE